MNMEIELVIVAVQRFLTSVTYKVEGRGRGNRCIKKRLDING